MSWCLAKPAHLTHFPALPPQALYLPYMDWPHTSWNRRGKKRTENSHPALKTLWSVSFCTTLFPSWQSIQWVIFLMSTAHTLHNCFEYWDTRYFWGAQIISEWCLLPWLIYKGLRSKQHVVTEQVQLWRTPSLFLWLNMLLGANESHDLVASAFTVVDHCNNAGFSIPSCVASNNYCMLARWAK